MAARQRRAIVRQDYKAMADGNYDRSSFEPFLDSIHDELNHIRAASQSDSTPIFTGLAAISSEQEAFDAELVELNIEEERMRAQVILLEKRRDVSALKARLNNLTLDVSAPPVNASTGVSTISALSPIAPVPANCYQEAVLPLPVPIPNQVAADAVLRQTLPDLRMNKILTSQVDSMMDAYGVLDPSASNAQHIKSARDCTTQQDEGHVGKIRPLKSGRVAKNSDIVNVCLLWPHTSLKFSYAAKDIKFDDLDLPLLVAGELEIQTNPIVSQHEKMCRMTLLQSVMYFSKRYVWTNCLEYFGAVLAHVERGGPFNDSEALAIIQQNTLINFKKAWTASVTSSISPSNYARSNVSPALPTHVMSNTTLSNKVRVPFFCKLYQTGAL
jgi:hypothetical protein